MDNGKSTSQINCLFDCESFETYFSSEIKKKNLSEKQALTDRKDCQFQKLILKSYISE